MFDFFLIQDLIKKDIIRNLLDFELKVVERTGELPVSKMHAHWNGLTFTITPGERFMKVQGSVHVFANNGENNNDRFTYNRFMNAVEKLSDYISPKDMINGIEIGLNITTPFNPSEFLSFLIAHKKKRFNRTSIPGQDSCEVTHSQYKIKIYNKGIQQGGKNLLRIEIKVFKMQWLHKSFPNGLCWQDLQLPDTWKILGQYLTKVFSEVVYYDPSIELSDLTSKDSTFLRQGNNPFYWERLDGEHQARLQKRYQSLVNCYGKKFNVIPDLILEELQRVLPTELAENYQSGQDSFEDASDQQNKKVAEIYHPEYNNLVPSLMAVSSQMAEIYPLLDGKVLNRSDPDRRCIITGLDISMQKPTSRFLNKKGLIYLYENDRKAYNQLLFQIPPKWHKESLDIQIYKIAHHIRDQYTNSKGYNKRAIKSLCSQPALFNNYDLISDEKKAIAYRL